MKRQLSTPVFNKYVKKLEIGEQFTAAELQSLITAINKRASDEQARVLDLKASNCYCPTPQGFLVGFDSIYDVVYDMSVYRPIFVQNLPPAVA
jgi:hypothetical protein